MAVLGGTGADFPRLSRHPRGASPGPAVPPGPAPGAGRGEPLARAVGLELLVQRGHLSSVPPILEIYTVTNPDVRLQLGVTDPRMTVPSVKKVAIRRAVELALEQFGAAPPHRFGMSDDDPANVVLAVSAKRDCKLKYPDKRFFVINTNSVEFVKLEIFPMDHPITAAKTGQPLLRDAAPPRDPL